MKIIRLPTFDIVIRIDGESGSINSSLHDDFSRNVDAYDHAINGLESLILAHACAGIDVASPAYLEGIETAVEAIANNTI